MKRFILSASALALLSGMALAPAQAAPYQHRHGGLTASERIAIGRSQHRVNVIKARARADGHVTFW